MIALPSFLLILVTAFSATLAIGAWRRRQAPGAMPFAVLMYAIAIWALTYGLELLAIDRESKILWAKAQYIGVVTVPLAWLFFARSATGRTGWLSLGRLSLLIVLHLLTLLLTWTNETHGLIWATISLEPTNPYGALHVTRGPWFIVYTMTSYLAMAAGTLLLVQTLRRGAVANHRHPSAVLLGVVPPWLANCLHISGLSPVPGLDLTPFAFAITGAVFAWGIVRARWLDQFLGLVPVARDTLIDRMHDAVLVIDVQGRLVDLNPAAQALIDRSLNQVLDQPAVSVLSGWPASIVEAEPHASLQGELTLSTGEMTRHYDLLVSPLWRRPGQPAGRLLVVREVTERKRTEAVQRFLSAATAMLASSLDEETTLTQLMSLSLPLLGDACAIHLVEPDDNLRQIAVAPTDPGLVERLVSLWQSHPLDRAGSHPVAQVLRTGQAVLLPVITGTFGSSIGQSEPQHRLIDGLGLHSLICVPLQAHDHLLGTLSFMLSRSSRRFGPADLALAEELAQRAALAVDNARLYGETQTALRLRDEFLSIASHELRTPLTTINGYVQLLVRQLERDEANPERLTELTGQLRAQVQRFEQLIDDLLDLSRIQLGRLELRPEAVDLSTLAHEVLERFAQAPERQANHRLVLATSGPLQCLIDPGRLDQVLTNLLSNALKYSPHGGEIRVAIDGSEAGISIAVSDQGIGITDAERERVFEPFVRGAQVGNRIRGVGLGLSITNQIVKLHGGHITLKSQAGTGSTFTVHLPANRLTAAVS